VNSKQRKLRRRERISRNGKHHGKGRTKGANNTETSRYGRKVSLAVWWLCDRGKRLKRVGKSQDVRKSWYEFNLKVWVDRGVKR